MAAENTPRSQSAAGGSIGSGAAVLSLGEALIDLIVSDGAPLLEQAAEFEARLGGAPANVAVALVRLGVPSAFGGVVGDDPFGRRLRDGLAAEGIDVSRVRGTGEAATTLAFAWKDERGDGHFWLLRGADARLSVSDVAAAGIEATAALVVGSVALAAESSRAAIAAAVEAAHAVGVPVCFDVNLRPTLWSDLDMARAACAPILARASLLKLSLDDARYLFPGTIDVGTLFERVRRQPATAGARTRDCQIVLTDGERGCWFDAGEGGPPRHVPAFPVAAVEPTGAGDAFTAALLARLLGHGWDQLREADVRHAAAAGALATTRAGAWDGLPTAVELERFLAEW